MSGNVSLDVDTIDRDGPLSTTFGTSFPDMLSVKVSQVAATYRKQLQVVKARLVLAREQSVIFE